MAFGTFGKELIVKCHGVSSSRTDMGDGFEIVLLNRIVCWVVRKTG